MEARFANVLPRRVLLRMNLLSHTIMPAEYDLLIFHLKLLGSNIII
jgi:hypothetical protein